MYLVSAGLPAERMASGAHPRVVLQQKRRFKRPATFGLPDPGIRDVRTTIGPSSRPILNPSSSIREMARPNYAGLRSGSRYLAVVAVSTDATRPC